MDSYPLSAGYMDEHWYIPVIAGAVIGTTYGIKLAIKDRKKS